MVTNVDNCSVVARRVFITYCVDEIRVKRLKTWTDDRVHVDDCRATDSGQKERINNKNSMTDLEGNGFAPDYIESVPWSRN